MKLKFYLCSFFLLMSGALFLNAQDQKEGESGETVFSDFKKNLKKLLTLLHLSLLLVQKKLIIDQQIM